MAQAVTRLGILGGKEAANLFSDSTRLQGRRRGDGAGLELGALSKAHYAPDVFDAASAMAAAAAAR
eukprot:2830498-Alexandrium_andersonii.AAC.1